MFRCSLCQNMYESVQGLMGHLQFDHILSVFSTLTCGQYRCNRPFDTFRSFKKHLANEHSNERLVVDHGNVEENFDFDENGGGDNVQENIADINVDVENVDAYDSDDSGLNEDHLDENRQETITLEQFVQATFRNAEMFSAYLNSFPTLNRKTVDLTLAGMSDFLRLGLVSSLKKKVVSLLEQCTCGILENEIFDIKSMFDVLENSLEHVTSEFKRLKSLSDAGTFVAPESHVLNYNNEFVRDGIDVDLVNNSSCAQVVPLRNSLKTFLEIPSMYQCMLDHIASLDFESNIVSDFLQAELWQEKLIQYEGKTVYPLFLHFDDYNADNALGSHAADGELGALYCSIASLPGYLRSSVLNVILVSLFKAKDRKKSGNLTTFQCVIEELKFLEEEGITLELPDGPIKIYFVLCLLVGDNKGNNSIQGFVEAFNAAFYCRVCKVNKDVASQLFTALPELRRNPANYDIDLATNDPQLTGVKERCVFDSIPSYCTVSAISCDLLHDISEGLLRYGLAAILKEIIHNRNYFDLQTFHERVDGFDYGPAEFGNKPPLCHLTIDRIRNDNLNLSASEALCLARYLGEIVGDLVPPDNLAWHYYTVLREIVEIVTSPHFVKGTEDYLRVVIREHHELYVQLAGYLRPKHHFVIHYPEILKRNGPFINYSALLLERKHRQGTMYARASNSRINLPLSVAVKIQLEFSHHVLTFNPTVTFKPLLKIRKIRVSALPNSNMFLGVLPFPPHSVVSITKAVDVFGTMYKVNMIVVIHSHDLFPEFGKICHIVIDNNQPMFIIKKLCTGMYREHISAYVVRDVRNEYLYVAQNMFVSYLPLRQRTSQAGEQVVSLRHSL